MRVLTAAKDEIVAMGFAPGGSLLAVGHQRHGLFLWDLGSDTPPIRCDSPGYIRPQVLTYSSDGQRLYLFAGRRFAVNLATGRSVPAGPEATHRVFDCATSTDGTRVVMIHGAWSAPKITAWAFAGPDDCWDELWTVESGQGGTGGLALAAADHTLAHLRRKPTLHWPYRYELVTRDLNSGLETGHGEYPYSYPSRLIYRPDGKQLVGLHEMTLLVWPIPRPRKPLYVRNDTRKHFTSAVYHPSGRYLFTTSNDTTVLVWDTESWRPVSRFTWNIGRLRCVAVSPDGTLAAAGSDRGQVMVWDVDL